MKRNIRIIVPVIMLMLLFFVQAKPAEADWFNPTKNVSGALYGSQVWSSNVNLVGDVMVMGDLEMRNIQITGNGYRIINSGKVIINGNVVLLDSSMSHIGGSMQVRSGSLTIRSTVQEAPSIPVVSEVTDSSTTVTGTAEADTWITVFIGNKILGIGRAYSDGTFSVTIPPQKAGTTLLVTSMSSALKESEAAEVIVIGDIPSITYKEWQPQQNVPKNKVWTIRFNAEVDESTITNKQIYIHNQRQEVKNVNLLLGDDKKSIIVQPLEGYEEGMTYYMYIESGLKSAKGDAISMPVRFSYTIEKESDLY